MTAISKSEQRISYYERIAGKMPRFADVDESGVLTFTYRTTHGEEKVIEIPPGNDVAAWVKDEIENFDLNYETYIWLDEFGHGKNGAPHDIQDILYDQKEWLRMMRRFRSVAAKVKKDAA